MKLFEEHIEPRLVNGAVGFDIPNGGHRAKKVAAALKKEGVTQNNCAIEISPTYLVTEGRAA